MNKIGCYFYNIFFWISRFITILIFICRENVKENDLVITIGAGNANKIGKMLVG